MDIIHAAFPVHVRNYFFSNATWSRGCVRIMLMMPSKDDATGGDIYSYMYLGHRWRMKNSNNITISQSIGKFWSWCLINLVVNVNENCLTRWYIFMIIPLYYDYYSLCYRKKCILADESDSNDMALKIGKINPVVTDDAITQTKNKKSSHILWHVLYFWKLRFFEIYRVVIRITWI